MYKTFQAFKPHFNALAKAGYFKRINNSKTSDKYYIIHKCYRIFIWIAVLTYNLQHVIRVIQVRHCRDQLVGTLFILLTTLNALGKQLAFNVRVNRIDNIIKIIDGPLFAPTNAYHNNMMRINAKSMSRLLNLYHVSIFVTGGLWTVYPLVNKALGDEVYITGYFPFNANFSPLFEVAILFMGINITLQAYGHVTMDCTIVAFYAQAKTQFQIFRHNIEHIVDDEKTIDSRQRKFIDEDENTRRSLHSKFVNCVKHYDKIVWFSREVESIFSEAMIIQFFVMAWVICMTMYKIVGLSLLSAEFFSMALYLGCMLAQLFIYCYYGTLLKIESENINESVYRSDWRSLSPRLRRLLLVLMERCKRPVEPRTAYVIPLSLDTYITVLRSSYALLTLLDRK